VLDSGALELPSRRYGFHMRAGPCLLNFPPGMGHLLLNTSSNSEELQFFGMVVPAYKPDVAGQPLRWAPPRTMLLTGERIQPSSGHPGPTSALARARRPSGTQLSPDVEQGEHEARIEHGPVLPAIAFV
jgi:hypothetical protein